MPREQRACLKHGAGLSQWSPCEAHAGVRAGVPKIFFFFFGVDAKAGEVAKCELEKKAFVDGPTAAASSTWQAEGTLS